MSRREDLEAAFEENTDRLVVFVHGLCETEEAWWLGTRADPAADAPAPRTYGARLRDDLGFSPLYLRYNSGLHISENGRRLSWLLEELCREWPVEVRELALVGHSMGGLVARSACHEAADGGAGLGRADAAPRVPRSAEHRLVAREVRQRRRLGAPERARVAAVRRLPRAAKPGDPRPALRIPPRRGLARPRSRRAAPQPGGAAGAGAGDRVPLRLGRPDVVRAPSRRGRVRRRPGPALERGPAARERTASRSATAGTCRGPATSTC